MDENEILSLIPRLYFVKGKKSKYELVKELNFSMSGRHYKKVDELIDMGFLEMVEHNPPKFEVKGECKKRMWNFWMNTPIGYSVMKMVEDRALVLK